MSLRVVKRSACPLWKKILLYLGAILAALAIGALVLMAIDVDPFQYYYRMFTMGTVGNRIAYKTFINYLIRFVPLAMTSLGLSLAFKMRFWNIGGEGQFIVGALAASAVALKWGEGLPSVLALLLMCFAAMVAAGLYGLLVAALKVRFNTNETLLTLMLNYIALYVLNYIMGTKAEWNFFLKPEDLRPVPQKLPENAMFPTFPMGDKFELNLCVILVLIIAAIIFIYLKHTKQGYEINVVGDSPGTARYAGMKVNRIVLRTVFLSACLIGLAAAFKMGTVGTLSNTITADVGWTGIIVAWLSQLNTLAILMVSALISLLHHGSVIAAATFSSVDSSFANMLQGFILFLVLVADFMIRFKIVLSKKEGKNG